MGYIEDKRYLKFGARCIFFNRLGGVSKSPYDSLNVSFNVGDDENSVNANIGTLKETLNAKAVCMINQVHSNKIVFCDDESKVENADGIYIDKENIFYGIKFADCMPVVLFDTKNRIGLCLHAGWRGSKLKIAKKAVKLLKEKGSNPKDIIATFGPHICGQCYEIQDDVASQFESEFIRNCNNKTYLDLSLINKTQLIEEGVESINIIDMGICTYENNEFFSYRRDKICGRNIGGLILKMEPAIGVEPTTC